MFQRTATHVPLPMDIFPLRLATLGRSAGSLGGVKMGADDEGQTCAPG
jgi:hypothetical protein